MGNAPVPPSPKRRSNWLGQGHRGAILRSAIVLFLGNGIGRFFGIVSTPFLTRIYSPDDFGLLAVFLSLVLIVSPLTTLRYVEALPLPRRDAIAMNLLVLGCLALLLTTVITIVILLLWRKPVLEMLSMAQLSPWWWLLVLAMIGTSGYELLSLWATRKRVFIVMARTQAAQSVIGTVLKVVFGLFGLQSLGLLVGQCVMQAGGVLGLWREFSVSFRKLLRHVTLFRIRMVAIRYCQFPTWRVPSHFLMAVSMHSPVIFVASLYDQEAAGQFGLAIMALAIPISIIGQSTGNALYGEAAALIKTDPGEIPKIANFIQIRLFLISLLPAAILFLYGGDIFAVVFGTNWRDAGAIASILSISLVFQLTSSPIVRLINLLEGQSFFLTVNTARFCCVVSVFYFANILSLELHQAITVYSIILSLFYFAVSYITLFLLRKETGRKNRVGT